MALGDQFLIWQGTGNLLRSATIAQLYDYLGLSYDPGFEVAPAAVPPAQPFSDFDYVLLRVGTGNLQQKATLGQILAWFNNTQVTPVKISDEFVWFLYGTERICTRIGTGGAAFGVDLQTLVGEEPDVPWYDTTSFLDLNFELNESWKGGVVDTAASQLSVVRVGDTAGFDERGGDIVIFPANTPRITSRGLLVEESMTHGGINTPLTGTVLGVIGSGGSLATGMSLSLVSGLVAEVVGIGEELGVPYNDVKISGIPAASTTCALYFIGASSIAAVLSGLYCASILAALKAGDMTGTTNLGVGIAFVDSGGLTLTSNTTNFLLTDELTRWYNSFTAANASTAFVRPRLTWTPTIGANVNFTLRIAAPQGAPRLYPYGIRMTSVAGAQAGDAVTVNTLDLPTGMNLSAVVEITSASDWVNIDTAGDAVGRQGIAWSDGTTNNMVRILRTAAGVLTINVRTAGVDRVNLSLGAWSANSPAQVAFSVEPTLVRASRDGAPLVSTALAAVVPSLETLHIGGVPGSQLGSEVFRRVTVYKRILSQEELEQKSKRDQIFLAQTAGNSLTYGYNPNYDTTQTDAIRRNLSPPGQLAKAWGGSFAVNGSRSVAAVWNRGVPGETVQQISARLLGSPLIRPRFTIIKGGRNNLKFDLPIDPQSVTDVVTGVAGMVSYCETQGLEFFVCPVPNYYYSIGPVDEGIGGTPGRYAYVVLDTDNVLEAATPNNFIDDRAYLIAHGNPITDAADIAANRIPQSLIVDGLSHYTPAANVLIGGECWYQALSAA